jgi:uncharacterized membrane protein YcfT
LRNFDKGKNSAIDPKFQNRSANPMPMDQKMSTDRIIFFDNIRYLMVLLVVVLHSACGYSNYTTFWAVNDTNSIIFDYLLGILGVFLMPTLFL